MRKRACDACHKRKIQCDGAVPQCNWCRHHAMTCTFNRVSARSRGDNDSSKSALRRAAAAGNGERIDLAHRLGRVEQLLAQRHINASPNRSPALADDLDSEDSENPSLYSASPRDPATPSTICQIPAAAVAPETPAAELLSDDKTGLRICFVKFHFAGYHLGDISAYSGIPLFSPEGLNWLRCRTGQDPALLSVEDRLPSSYLRLPIYGIAQQPGSVSLSLPERTVIDEGLRFFHNSPLKLEFPMIDSVLFQQTINTAYDSSQGPVSLSAACIFSFLAVLSLFSGHGCSAAHRADGHEYSRRAQAVLTLLPQEFNITSLQTIMMLSMYQLFSGQIASATMFHSLACRIMFMLGGHTLPDPWSEHTGHSMDYTVRARRQLRKLFWLCYIFDKEISIRTGQPPSIDDAHCDLTLPNGYLDIQYIDYSDVTLLDDAAVPVLPGDLRLSIIKSKACKLLYSVEALRKSDTELLRDIRELDDELERWRLSVPPKHRPTLSIAWDASIDHYANAPDRIRTIVINFEYHYLVATIHRATGRCRAWANAEGGSGGGGGEMEGVSSSLMLSVEASRSTLLFLRTTVRSLLGEAFWMIVFYPMSAVITVFCGILLNPLDPRTDEDLKLLAAAPELMKTIRTRALTLDEMVHLRMVEDFLMELTRLGNCAVLKARQEQVGRVLAYM
ncbi:fungal-specific transcription factor domain-containing protein [Podospora appendiculata]|uniref:Fungal-specific transcription factor domain-containing protein n=1 Tax=Podospora appendiculata TaxID=314037 RepID=A0AAE1C9F1_9PEZI|nr:fungal-specific transcription factor domain-containing protein [Podospora appendiculata]